MLIAARAPLLWDFTPSSHRIGHMHLPQATMQTRDWEGAWQCTHQRLALQHRDPACLTPWASLQEKASLLKLALLRIGVSSCQGLAGAGLVSAARVPLLTFSTVLLTPSMTTP